MIFVVTRSQRTNCAYEALLLATTMKGVIPVTIRICDLPVNPKTSKDCKNDKIEHLQPSLQAAKPLHHLKRIETVNCGNVNDLIVFVAFEVKDCEYDKISDVSFV